ncbi:MAG: TIM barrel protein [Pseudomonadota bacterium]
MQFSANLGFLWTELSLPDGIRAAHHAGFDAVECHFPYDEDPSAVVAALEETGLPMLGLNTVRGNVEAGEFGLCALPGRQADARASIEQAVTMAKAIGAQAVHCMAGRTVAPGARIAYLENLTYAADLAEEAGLNVLIEPINHRDAPDYHLRYLEEAEDVIRSLQRPCIRLMFDLYHSQITQGDLIENLRTYLPIIGHVQIAAVPSRQEPDGGEVDYPQVLKALAEMGYEGYVGAEYRPGASTEAGLGWLAAFRETLER